MHSFLAKNIIRAYCNKSNLSENCVSFKKLQVETLSYLEFKSFVFHSKTIPEYEMLKTIFDDVFRVVNLIVIYLEMDSFELKDNRKLKTLIDKANALKFIDFGINLEQIKVKYLEVDFISEYKKFLNTQNVQIDHLEKLQTKYLFLPFTSNTYIANAIDNVNNIFRDISLWNKTVNLVLTSDEKISFENLETLVNIKDISPHLKSVDLGPSILQLTDLLNDARQFTKQIELLLCENKIGKNILSSNLIDYIVEREQKCKLQLNIDVLQNELQEIKAWISEFNSTFSLDSSQNRNTSNMIFHDLITSFQSNFEKQNMNAKSLFEQPKYSLEWLENQYKYCISESLTSLKDQRRLIFYRKELLDKCDLCYRWFRPEQNVSNGNVENLKVCNTCNHIEKADLNKLNRLMSKLSYINIRFIEGEFFKLYYNNFQELKMLISSRMRCFSPQIKSSFDMFMYQGVFCLTFDTLEIENHCNLYQIDNWLLMGIILQINLPEVQYLCHLASNESVNIKLLYYYPNDNQIQSTVDGTEPETEKNLETEMEDSIEEIQDIQRFVNEITYDEDWNEICEDSCRMPTKFLESIEWIYCSQCDKWFHKFCQNAMGNYQNSAEFICRLCLNL